MRVDILKLLVQLYVRVDILKLLVQLYARVDILKLLVQLYVRVDILKLLVQLYMRVDIPLACGKQLHDRIISSSTIYIWAHNTSLTPPFTFKCLH